MTVLDNIYFILFYYQKLSSGYIISNKSTFLDCVLDLVTLKLQFQPLRLEQQNVQLQDPY